MPSSTNDNIGETVIEATADIGKAIEKSTQNKPELNSISTSNKIKILCIALVMIYIGSKLYNTNIVVSKAVGFSLVVLNTGIIINLVFRYLMSSSLFYDYRSVSHIL